ncbi:MAG: serine/threonine-protein kinase, partial [Deltaproteobacteria bacterium]
MAAANDPRERIGTTLAGKYKLTRLLGVGGMGAVFEGTNTWTDRRVAIKLMLTANGAIDPELGQRFMREAKAATKIAHENIVDILDMGQDADGSLFIVQEFLAGTDLRHVLDERGAISPRETAEILAPVMSALIAAHKHGIVHRDLKPDNIFLTKSSSGNTVPKLIDFGIAKMDEGQGRGLTKTGAAMGTPHYMSPEQAGGQKSIDQQTDIWAIGVVLFEMLSGQMPYDGDNYNQLMVKIATEPPRLIEDVAPDIAPSLAAVVHRALNRDRTQRFRTMQQFLGALLDARTEGDEAWNHTLRAALKDVLAAADTGSDEFALTTPAGSTVPDEATTRRNPEPVQPLAAVPVKSTLGRTGREIDAPATTTRSTTRWILSGAAVLVVAGVAVGGVLATRKTPSPMVSAPRAASAPMTAPPTTPAAVPVAPVAAPETFLVSVVAQPSTAHIELDHERLPGNAVVRSLPRNGVGHLLSVTAEGYEPFEVGFMDNPPPSSVMLTRVVRG